MPADVVERRDQAASPNEPRVHTPVRHGRPAVLWGLVAVLAGWFAITHRHDLAAAVAAAAHGDPRWTAGAIAIAVLAIVNLAALQWRCQALLGVRRSFADTVRLTAAAHALDLATKAGGAVGALRFAKDARRRGQSAQRAAAGCVLGELCTHLGFTAALALAVPIALFSGHLTGIDVVAVAIYVSLNLALIAAVVGAGRSRSAIRRLVAVPHVLRQRLSRSAATPAAVGVDEMADDLHLAITNARSNRHARRPIAIHALLWPTTGALLLATSCAAVGAHLDAGAVLVTYCLATTFSIVGVLPGGIGFAEVSMAASLHLFGVDAAHAFAAIALYRLFDLWLPLLGGALTLRSREPKRSGPASGPGSTQVGSGTARCR